MRRPAAATPRGAASQVVYEELKALMGGQHAELVQPKYGPSVILMAGLQVRDTAMHAAAAAASCAARGHTQRPV